MISLSAGSVIAMFNCIMFTLRRATLSSDSDFLTYFIYVYVYMASLREKMKPICIAIDILHPKSASPFLFCSLSSFDPLSATLHQRRSSRARFLL